MSSTDLRSRRRTNSTVNASSRPGTADWWAHPTGCSSGTPRKSALVADLKSGFAVVEKAELNLQLRGYAVLVDDVSGNELGNVYVSILQPRLWSPSERITLARYTRDDLSKAREHIYDIIEKSERKDAPLVAGEEQCRYCKAKLMCPAFRAKVTLPVGAFRSELDLSKAAREAFIEQRIKQCNDEQLEEVLEAISLAGFVETPARDEARMRIRSGRFTNYTLGKDWEARTITNVRRAIGLLVLGRIATREEILDICDIPVKKLEEAFRAQHGGTWKDARDKINRVLASVIEREPRQPKLLRK